jgi:hypothetical protein
LHFFGYNNITFEAYFEENIFLETKAKKRQKCRIARLIDGKLGKNQYTEYQAAHDATNTTKEQTQANGKLLHQASGSPTTAGERKPRRTQSHLCEEEWKNKTASHKNLAPFAMPSMLTSQIESNLIIQTKNLNIAKLLEPSPRDQGRS